MTEAIRTFFSNIFGDNVVLATILIAMLPIIELRGAIPFAMSVDFWGGMALNNIRAFLFSFLGSSLVVPFLALLFIPIINALKKTKLFKGLAEKLENRVKSKTEKLENNDTPPEGVDKKRVNNVKKLWLKAVGLFMFVAIPLPLTGVWTGTCIGVMLGFNFWQNCAIVISGNLVAGIIMTFVCSVFPEFTSIVLYVFLGLVVIFALYELIKNLIRNKDNN